MSASVPTSLSSLRAYVDRAAELKALSPIVAYQLRVLTATIGISLARDAPAKLFLKGLLEQLEVEKAGVSQQDEDSVAAMSKLAIDLHGRAVNADQPDNLPSPALKWSITEAPRVAKCFHACAVVLDALRQLGPLTPVLARMQLKSHARARQLAAQISRAFRSDWCIPQDWQPASQKYFPQPEVEQPAEQPAEQPSPLHSVPSGSNRSEPSVHTAPLDPTVLVPAPASIPPDVCSKTASQSMPPSSVAGSDTNYDAGGEPLPLPFGWEEHQDSSTGRSYFVDAINKRTSWRRPSPETAVAAASATDINVNEEPGALPERAQDGGGIANRGDAVAHDAEELVSLSPGWEAKVDPASGRRFYVDLVNRCTSWTLPTQAAGATEATETVPMGTAGATEATQMVPMGSAVPLSASQAVPGIFSTGEETEQRWLQLASAEGMPSEAETKLVNAEAARALDVADTIWTRLRLEPTRQSKSGGETDPDGGVNGASLTNDTAGDDREVRRERVKADRAALRAAAVSNILELKKDGTSAANALKSESS